jgi:hypothetical protein
MQTGIVTDTYLVNYDTCYKHNFKTDAKAAVKFYLELGVDFKYSTEYWGGFILYPQALNPFLKIMESLRETQNIVVFPAFDNDGEESNKPAYLILKIDCSNKYPSGILMSYEKI